MSSTFLAFLALGFVLVSGVESQSATLGVRRERQVARNETDKEAKKYGKMITEEKSVTRSWNSLTILRKIVKSGFNGNLPDAYWFENSTFPSNYRLNNRRGKKYFDSLYYNSTAFRDREENVTFYEDLLSVSDNTIDPGKQNETNIFNSAHSIDKTSPLDGVSVYEPVTNGENYFENASFLSEGENHLKSADYGRLEKKHESLISDRANLTTTDNFFIKSEESFALAEENLLNPVQETTSADDTFYDYQSTRNNSTESSDTSSSTKASHPSNSIDTHIDKDLQVTSNDYSGLETNSSSVEPFSPSPSGNYSTTTQNWPLDEWVSQGVFTKEYLSKVSEYWLSFPQTSPNIHYALAGIYVIIMLVGMTGNLLVIIMFCRCKSLKTPANILVMNLALSDLFLLAKMPIFIFNSIHLGPALGEIGCKIYGFVGGLTGTVSIATLAAISIDRYFVIVYPLEATCRSTRMRSRLLVVFVWLYGLTFSTVPLLGFDFATYVPEGLLTSCSFNYLDPNPKARAFIFVFFVAAWVMPCFVLIFSYQGIWRGVVVAREVRPGGDLMRHCREDDNQSTELRLAKMVLGVVLLWFVSWTPYAVVALLGITGNKDLLSPVGSMIPALLAKFASAADPYVYAVTHQRFRQELFKGWNRIRGKPQLRASQVRSRMVTIREFVDHNSDSSDSDPGIELKEIKPQEAEPEAAGAPVDRAAVEEPEVTRALVNSCPTVEEPEAAGEAVNCPTVEEPDAPSAPVDLSAVEEPEVAGEAVNRLAVEEPEAAGEAVNRLAAEEPEAPRAPVDLSTVEEPEAARAPVDLSTVEAAPLGGDILPPTGPRETKQKMTKAVRVKCTVRVIQENLSYTFSEIAVRDKNNTV